ncbi:MAG TPA: hypothetical protein VE526_02770 [Solirubrobacteraceae bacterium]|jgi:hypothetical protein|nr:hypothetical protein [Solirubrobacteraceae bacterium]
MEPRSTRDPLVERITEVAEQDTGGDEPTLELRDRPVPSRAQRERSGSTPAEVARDADG